MLKKYFGYLVKNSLNFFNQIFKLIGIKNDVILFSSSNDSPYTDNSKYLFEYLSKKKLDVFWVTNDIKIKKYLTKHNLNYIGYSNIFNFIYVVLKTKIIFSSGSDYFHCFNFLNKREVIKIHLGHGAGNKVVIQKYIKTNKFENYSKFNYVNFTSDFTIKNIGLKNYKLNKKKIINFGYPRIESLINDKNIKNKILPFKFIGHYEYDKIILYTPTWRPYKYNFPLFSLKGFDLIKFNNFLKKQNIFFCISFHPIAPVDVYKFKNLKLSNIKLIDKKVFPSFDTTYFLKFVDILLNDCSTTSTDFTVLKKPQIFVFPDYKKYIKHTSFLEDYEQHLPGSLIENFKDLKKEISKNIKNNRLYKKKFAKELRINLKKYYDHKITKKVNHKFYCFTKSLLNKNRA